MNQLDHLIGLALTHLEDAPVNERITLLQTAAAHLESPHLREHCEVTAAALKHAERCQLQLAELFQLTGNNLPPGH